FCITTGSTRKLTSNRRRIIPWTLGSRMAQIIGPQLCADPSTTRIFTTDLTVSGLPTTTTLINEPLVGAGARRGATWATQTRSFARSPNGVAPIDNLRNAIRPRSIVVLHLLGAQRAVVNAELVDRRVEI